MDTLGHLTAAVSRTLDLQRFDSLIDALWEATTLVAKFHRTRDFEVSYKGADDPVTRADVAAHEVVAARLTSLYPAEFDSGRMYLISEEDHGRHEDPLVFEQQRKPLNRDGSVWLLDPIDGTKEFVSGQGDFTVNLALIRNESPMLGIVTLPERYEGDQKAQSEMMFVGVVGLGAYELHRDGTTSCISCRRPGIPLSVLSSKRHNSDRTTGFLNSIPLPVELKLGGSSMKIINIARGLADMYPRWYPTNEWDTAAAHAVLLAAGGNIFDASDIHTYAEFLLSPGTSLRYNKPNMLNPSFICAGAFFSKSF